MKIKLSDIAIFIIGAILGYVLLTYTLNTMKFVSSSSEVAKEGATFDNISEKK